MKFHELTSARLASIDRDQTLVIVPIAAVEQHGPHMPTGTDFILCTAVAEAVEKRLSDRVLLTPTVWLGASAHHLRLGSTLNSALDTYISTPCGSRSAKCSPNIRKRCWRPDRTGQSPTSSFGKHLKANTNSSGTPANSKRR